MGYKMKGFSGFKESPAKAKGDNLKRIMTEKKALAKKTGTFYASGAEPKVKVPNVKGFNVKGSSWPEKTPGYSTTKRAKKAKAKAFKEFDKWHKTLGKTKSVISKAGKFLGGKLTGTLGLMGAGTLSATAGNVSKKSEGEQIKDLLTKHKLKGGN